MKHCKYCASTTTKLDSFGFCIKYDCFSKSGMKAKLDQLKIKTWKYLEISDCLVSLGISSYVTNFYNKRTRYCNDIIEESNRIFGFVPNDILNIIPSKHRKRWDKDIRW